MKRRLLTAAFLLAAATNVVLLRAFLDASGRVVELARERADHRCPPSSLVFESKPPESFRRLLVEPAPMRDPALPLVQGSEGGRG